MPGMGGGSNTMAGNMLNSMYAPRQAGGSMSPQQPGGSQGGGGFGGGGDPVYGGWGGFGITPRRPPGPWNNWGMGDAPSAWTPAMSRLQEQCLAGDGSACNHLKVLQSQQQQAMSDFQTQTNNQAQWLNRTPGGGSMGSRSMGGGW